MDKNTIVQLVWHDRFGNNYFKIFKPWIQTKCKNHIHSWKELHVGAIGRF
jgi:hypothetical protein